MRNCFFYFYFLIFVLYELNLIVFYWDLKFVCGLKLSFEFWCVGFEMAWFNAKNAWGNFPDLAGAVNKLQESVKSIEKNFDTALGFEEKDGESSNNEQGNFYFRFLLLLLISVARALLIEGAPV